MRYLALVLLLFGFFDHTTITTISNVTVKMPTTIIAPNTCTNPTSVPMNGLTSNASFTTAFASNPSSISGWGSVGGLVFNAWPTNNTLNWNVCNQSNVTITPGAITLNVGAN